METLESILVIAGLTSVALLWVFSIAGAMQSLWDTFGEHARALIERLKR